MAMNSKARLPTPVVAASIAAVVHPLGGCDGATAAGPTHPCAVTSATAVDGEGVAGGGGMRACGVAPAMTSGATGAAGGWSEMACICGVAASGSEGDGGVKKDATRPMAGFVGVTRPGRAAGRPRH